MKTRSGIIATSMSRRTPRLPRRSWARPSMRSIWIDTFPQPRRPTADAPRSGTIRRSPPLNTINYYEMVTATVKKNGGGQNAEASTQEFARCLWCRACSIAGAVLGRTPSTC